MRHVPILTNVYTSALGFGCASILGSVGAEEARAALRCAYDCGIRHFDLAPSYGYGAAEAFVARHMPGRRDDVTYATKFGIRANWKATVARPLKGAVRLVRRLQAPVARGKSDPARKTTADRLLERVPMRPDTMRRSLEGSLRRMQTSYIDILFLHDPVSSLANLEDLASCAGDLKNEGKIRGWGIAFQWKNEPLFRQCLPRLDALQFDNSPWGDSYEALRKTRAQDRNIFFSPLRGAPEIARHADSLRTIFNDFPASVVLCSMFNPAHIKANAEAAGSVIISPSRTRNSG